MNAPVTLVDYGDYECPACGMAHPVTKMLTGHFHDRLRFVFYNFPLAQVHPNAETAEFAATQGQCCEMHDALYENQAQMGLPLFLSLAEALGLSSDELADALASGRYRSKVREDFMGGVRSGVNGTPTFFINGPRHDGSFSYDVDSLQMGYLQVPEAAKIANCNGFDHPGPTRATSLS